MKTEKKHEFFYGFGVETDEQRVVKIMDRLSALDPLTEDLAMGFLGHQLFRSALKAGQLTPSTEGRFSIAELDVVLSGGLFFHMDRDDAAEEIRMPRKALEKLSDKSEGPAFNVVNGVRFYRISSVVEYAGDLPKGSVKQAARVPVDFWEEFEIL
jgi:hypothetical protein